MVNGTIIIIMKEKRFLFLELLIIVGVTAFLVSVFFVLNDPKGKFAGSRNDRRWTDVSLILDAVSKYAENHNGEIPPGIDESPDTLQVIGSRSFGCGIKCKEINAEESCLDLSGSLADGYIKNIPFDPLFGSEDFTKYYINRLSDGRIEAGACEGEVGARIMVVR